MRRSCIHPIEMAAGRHLPPEGKVLAAVSGGPDSVAALRAALVAAPGRVEAAHCNFSLRKEESLRDEAFVADLCLKLGVKLHSVRFDTHAFMKENPNLSLEMACRNLRYDWFEALMGSESIDCLVLGHNADDNIETMLLNLLRGAGAKGLAGMVSERDGILRPLLAFSRKDILDYLDFLHQDYVVDSSNLKSDFRRNFLRNELIPLLETRWPGAKKALSRSRAVLEAESRIVDAAMADVSDRNCTWLPFARLEQAPDSGTLLFHFIRKVGGSAEVAAEMDASWKARSEPGKTWALKGVEVEKEREGFRIVGNDEDFDSSGYSWSRFNGSWHALQALLKEEGNNIAALPFGPDAYQVRRAATGDRIESLGVKGSKLLSDAMRDARWPLWKRKRLNVAEREGNIIWADGLARSRRDLVSPDSKEIWILSRSKDQQSE